MKCCQFIFLCYIALLLPTHANDTILSVTDQQNTTEISSSNEIGTENREAISPNEDADEGFISDLRPAVKLPLPLWMRITMGLIVIALIVYIIRHFIIHHKKKIADSIVPIDPYTQALCSLEKALQLIQRLDQRPFAFAITDAVRQYLASVFKLPAPECTTEEVLEKLPNVETLTTDTKEDIKDFLTQCDLAKFTQQKFDNNIRLKLYQQAKAVIQSADKLLHAKAETLNPLEEK